MVKFKLEKRDTPFLIIFIFLLMLLLITFLK